MPHSNPSPSPSERSEPSPSSTALRTSDVFSGFIPPILAKRVPRVPRPEQTYGKKAQKKPATKRAENAPALKTPTERKPKDPLQGYVLLDRVEYVGTQICPECSRTTRYIAGDLLRFEHTTEGCKTLRTRAFDAVDARCTQLKRTIEYLTPETCVCAECRGMGAAFDVAFSGRGQLPLL